MSRIADQLKQTFGKPDGEALSTLDLMSLPPSVRRIINLMLRKYKITYPELCKTVAELPEPKRVSQAELDEILAALCQVGWLDQEQSGDVITYKVSLNPKPGSASVDSPLDVLEEAGETAVPSPQFAAGNQEAQLSQSSRGLLDRIKGMFSRSRQPK